MKKELECLHYKGEGYVYELKNGQICLCRFCNRKLLFQMKEQERLERELKEMKKKKVKKR